MKPVRCYFYAANNLSDPTGRNLITINTRGLKPGATFIYPYRVKDWKTFAFVSALIKGHGFLRNYFRGTYGLQVLKNEISI